jgi:hypothetical protein
MKLKLDPNKLNAKPPTRKTYLVKTVHVTEPPTSDSQDLSTKGQPLAGSPKSARNSWTF